MKLLTSLRSRLFPSAAPVYVEPDDNAHVAKHNAAVARLNAIELMKQWSPERVADLERIANKNFVEVYLVPEQTERNLS